jgi:hypothetical protein
MQGSWGDLLWPSPVSDSCAVASVSLLRSCQHGFRFGGSAMLVSVLEAMTLQPGSG